ncbi:MAG: 6-carboxytetrahydropterin synthase [Calothrix sp. SM1_5_4]|nr:6-carboxytetrahydropterin synthase [Calothrix sp. SM1_5_4]
MYQISKTYQFEAAHRLIAPYSGKCNSLHGHSFRVTLTLASECLDACDMVADFSSLKPVGEWIMARLDHAVLVAEGDRDLREWLEARGQKHFVVSGNPTSELVAKLIFDRARALGFSPVKVDVSETCTASASYVARES